MARVGLLEDNNRISKLCATMLIYAGHEVRIYTSAQECLNALSIPCTFLARNVPCNHATDFAPLPIDVLVLDLHLPTIPGLEVLHLLRSCPHTSALPLVFCTAATNSEIIQALTIAPQAILVEKPFRLQTLVSAISTVLPPVN